MKTISAQPQNQTAVPAAAFQLQAPPSAPAPISLDQDGGHRPDESSNPFYQGTKPEISNSGGRKLPEVYWQPPFFASLLLIKPVFGPRYCAFCASWWQKINLGKETVKFQVLYQALTTISPPPGKEIGKEAMVPCSRIQQPESSHEHPRRPRARQ